VDQNLHDVIAILGEIRELVRGPNADVIWSSYNTGEEALTDIDQHIARLTTGDTSKLRNLALLFAPTGNFQEISLGSGWSDEFLEIAARFDKAYEKLSDTSGAMLSRADVEISPNPNPAKA
jgi:hypothetical protein